MSCYVVFDTNVLVSSLLTSNEISPTVQLMAKALAGELTPVYSADMLREYQEVLLRPKFSFPAMTVLYLLGAIEKYGFEVQPAKLDEWPLPDKKDLPFFAAAIARPELSCWLITGNLKHFPAEKFVVSPRQFWDILTLH